MTTKNYTIYVIDDDESVRRALKRIFKSVGLEAETFASADEFLKARHPHSRSCLIVDVKMPGMSGLEMQQHLNDSGIQVPIIFISAYQDDTICAQVIKAGAKAFLLKPFNDETLLNEVYSAIGLKSK